MTTRKVGITGSAGFIGRHLEAWLRQKGHDVICFEGDIVDPDGVRRLVEDCEVIFHLAGRNIGPEDEILRVNTEGTRLLAEAAAALGDRHVIFSSSNLVVRRPESAYAKSKLAGEEMLAGIAGSNGCKVSLFRIANVYGPGSRPFYNSVVATFCWYAATGRRGELPIHGDGSQVVEFVPVGEVVEILSASLDQAEPLHQAEIPGEAFPVRELGETICDAKKRAAHPALEAQFQSYRSARLTGQKEVRSYPIHSRASGSFQELLHDDETTFGQLSICTHRSLRRAGRALPSPQGGVVLCRAGANGARFLYESRSVRNYAIAGSGASALRTRSAPLLPRRPKHRPGGSKIPDRGERGVRS